MNGWSNGATWCVKAWFDNDWTLYNELERQPTPLRSSRLRTLWSDYAPDNAKADLSDSWKGEKVNWEELAEKIKD